MSPVIANRLPIIRDWNTPMDFGKSWRGKRVLGDNKRLRGLLFGGLMGGLTAVIVSKLNTNAIVTIEPFWAGVILGTGALLGDALESFIKRRRGISPGQTWYPFDQLDYVAGGLLLIYPFVQLPQWALVTIVVVYFGLHLVIAYLAYLLGLKDKPI